MPKEKTTLNGLDTAELNRRLTDMQEQMFRLRFQINMGQTEGVSKLRSLRKEKARALTYLRQRELGMENGRPVATQGKKTRKSEKAS